MSVTSAFTFNGENAMLKLHLSILDDYVDQFVIVEANKTFTGKDKPLYYFRDERFFKPWAKKIHYYVVNQWDDPELWEMAVTSPNTKGAEHWKREFYIKEHIQKALQDCAVKDNDLVFIGDVDEIVDPQAQFSSESPAKARLRVYSYYLNNMSNEKHWGTLMAKYGDIKNECLNHMRSDKKLYSKGEPIGWHFTNMGGIDEVMRKLDNSYTEDSYYTPEVKKQLSHRYSNREDYLGRDFTFEVNEDHWPQYLKENKREYPYDRMCI